MSILLTKTPGWAMVILAVLSLPQAMAQTTYAVSLEEAQAIALENAFAMQYAALDRSKAERDVKEILATGLPQINLVADYSQYIDIPTQVAGGDVFGFPDYLTSFLGGVAQETGVIGLHVRHGDACVHAAQSNTRPLCRRFEEYLPALAQMRDRYAVRTVFVSTDDAAVAQAAPAALAALGMRAVSLELDRSVFASSWFIEHRVEAAALDGSGLAESMLLDLLLLADCDFLVGTLSSQMSRLALALMTLRLGGVPPFVSVEEMPWGCCSWAGENLEGLNKPLFDALSFHRF